MKTTSLNRFAPDLRVRGRSAEPAKEQLHVHLNADFELDSDLADLGAAFAGGPIHEVMFDLDPETGLTTLAEVYAYRVFRAYRWQNEGSLKWSRLVLRFARDLYVVARSYGAGFIYASSAEKAEALLAELATVLGAVPKPTEAAFYMIRRDGGDIAADAVRNVPEAMGDEFLSLAYGADVQQWIADFASRTAARTGGLTILEGPPGTGKTSLVSELFRRLRETHLFYVLPVNNDATLTSPDWMSFWQSQNRIHPDRIKVVVMEDAERVLLNRHGSERDAVAAVLNIADGLIGRMLKVHLLCSVNARLEQLDPAIQRPGRLMNYRRFAPMPRDRAAALAALKAIPFSPRNGAEEFTLAEVLQPSPVEHQVAEKRSIGFVVR
jgi:hypothetical protein